MYHNGHNSAFVLCLLGITRDWGALRDDLRSSRLVSALLVRGNIPTYYCREIKRLHLHYWQYGDMQIHG